MHIYKRRGGELVSLEQYQFLKIFTRLPLNYIRWGMRFNCIPPKANTKRETYSSIIHKCNPFFFD